MNLVSKGALAAMTLALDFAAGNVLDVLWEADFFAAKAEATVVRDAQLTSVATIRADLARPDPAQRQPGGGVCKPSEHSVMVLEIKDLPTGTSAKPRHVCIRAMTGELDLMLQLDSSAAAAAE